MQEPGETMPSQQRGSHSAWRILLGCGAVTAFLCCVATLGATLLGMRLWPRMMITHPARIAEVGRQIAHYRVPEGYKELFASDLLGFKIVVIGPADSHGEMLTILLLQLPPVEVEDAELRRQIEETMAQQTGMGGAEMRPAGSQRVTIRGQEVELTLRTGKGPGGEQLRQLSGMFSGANGPVLLLITGVERAWDASRIDAFIASIE